MLHKELHVWKLDELDKEERKAFQKRIIPLRCRICDNPQPIIKIPEELQGHFLMTCPHCGVELVILAIELDTPDYKNIANA